MNLDRTQLLVRIEEIEFFPEFKKELDWYLPQYILVKDLIMVEALLKAGASPNSKENLDDYLLHLLHEYEVEKTLSGKTILALFEILLEYGANPNRVVMNNQRAYDYTLSRRLNVLKDLLLAYGATIEKREWI